MSDVKLAPYGVAFREVPSLQSDIPEKVRHQVAALQRTLANTDTYNLLCVRDTSPFLTRAVKRLVAKVAPGKTYEFKSGHLSGRATHREAAFPEQLQGLRSALSAPEMSAPFTLYVYVGEREWCAQNVRQLIATVNEMRPDVKLVIGRASDWSAREEFAQDFFEMRNFPWSLYQEALGLMVAKSGLPISAQDAQFWLGRFERDDAKRILSQAVTRWRACGSDPYPEDAELALAAGARLARGQAQRNGPLPIVDCVVPHANRPEAPVRSRMQRDAVAAAIADLNGPTDPFGGVALCRVEDPMENDAVPQLIDACTDLPVYRVINASTMSWDGDADARLSMVTLARVLRETMTESPAVFYLPMRWCSGETLRHMSDALHAVDPELKLVVATSMDKAMDDAGMEWFDATTLGMESPDEVRNKGLLASSGLAIAPARGAQILKPLNATAAAAAIRQAQVQRRRVAMTGMDDVALLQSAVRTLRSAEKADTSTVEKYLVTPDDPRAVKDAVAGIPRAVLQFAALIKHWAQVKQVVPSAAKTLLLKGPPGTGKTATAKALAAETGFPLFAPKSSEMVSKWIGESANAVYKLFEGANTYARIHDTTALVFIDEIDALLKARGGGEGGEREYERITNALLECIQATADSEFERVVVIGATNLAHQMDPAALDRFAIKAEIALPDVAQLKEIFTIHLKGRTHNLSEAALQAAAERAYKTRFSGRRVVHALNEAGFAACDENREKPCINDAHLQAAVQAAATAQLEGEAESGQIRATQFLLRDIEAGTLGDNAVGAPFEVLGFLRAIRAHKRLKRVVPNAKRSMLLKGPPGTGKTSIVRGLAAETGFPLFAPKSGSLIGPMLGQTVERFYKFVEQVRAYATAHNTTAIIFFDEMDALVAQRHAGGSENNRLVNAFLETLEGIRRGEDDNVVIIGATNLEGQLDEAMLERFSCRVEVGMPDVQALESIFRLHLRDRVHSLQDADIKSLAQLAHDRRFNGRNVVHVLDGAGSLALETAAEDEDLILTPKLVRAAMDGESKSRGAMGDSPPPGLYV